MSFSYPLDLPTSKAPASVLMSLQHVIGATISDFTLEEEFYEWPGQKWLADINLPPMERADAEEWIAWALRLRGRKGTFLLGDPACKTPRGIATGAPKVDGASQTGYYLATKGWTANKTGILLKGDYLQRGTGSSSRLHKLTADADSDGSGKATLEITPAIVADDTSADNADIVVNSARGVFRLTENLTSWNIGAAKIFGFSFRAGQAL